jgi:hypothetical protein
MRLASLLLLLLAAAAAAQDVLVVAPPALEPALAEWRKHREAQGLAVAVRPPAPDLSGVVREAHRASGGRLRFVLLLGDVRDVPCAFEPGEIIRIWERDPKIANDNRWADLDGDRLPDVAIGRIPADDVEGARGILGRIVAYENGRDFSSWRRRVNVIAGVGGFGKFADMALEQVASTMLTRSVPHFYDLHVTYANPPSPFCPHPPEVRAATLRRFNEGALVVAYLGHGNRFGLDRVRFEGKAYEIFDEDSALEVEVARGSPVVFLVACSTGHMDGTPDCLAETLLGRPKGPVAVLASSRVSMPYANAVFAKEVLDAIFHDRPGTLGEAFLLAKRRLLEPRPGDQVRDEIEFWAQGYQADPKKREQERAEHLYLYNLFGDPCLRLARPADMALSCAAEVRAGGRLEVSGGAEEGADVLVELVAERTPNVPRRRGDSYEDFARTYTRSNRWVRASATAKAPGGRFVAVLEVPTDLPAGTYHARAFVEGPGGAAVGGRKVAVRAAE